MIHEVGSDHTGGLESVSPKPKVFSQIALHTATTETCHSREDKTIFNTLSNDCLPRTIIFCWLFQFVHVFTPAWMLSPRSTADQHSTDNESRLINIRTTETPSKPAHAWINVVVSAHFSIHRSNGRIIVMASLQSDNVVTTPHGVHNGSFLYTNGLQFTGWKFVAEQLHCTF